MAQSVQIKKINWWHDAIINWMLAFPDKQLVDCARNFNVSRAWLSVIINSDVFKAELQSRQQDLGTIVDQDILTKLTSVAEGSLEELDRRISNDGASIPTKDLNNVAHNALASLGYGAPKNPGGIVNNFQVVTVSTEQLAAARARISARHTDPGVLLQIPEIVDHARLLPNCEVGGAKLEREGEGEVAPTCPSMASPEPLPHSSQEIPVPQFSERPRTLEDLD